MITARREHKTRKPADVQEDVSCDLKTTLKLSADAKAEWVPKALKAIQTHKVKAQDVYDIVTHPRFTSGVGNRAGQSILRSVTENILVFSDKQREAFSKSKLFQEFAVQSQLQKRADSPDDEEDDKLQKRARNRSSSSSSGGRRRSRSRRKDKRKATEDAPESSGAAPPLPPGGTGDDRSAKRSSRYAAQSQEEKAAIEQALREQEEKREEDRKKAEAERLLAKEREMQRRAKLGSAFLVDDEEEEEMPQIDMNMAKKAKEKQLEERSAPLMIDYDRRGAASSGDGPEAARFVESMGGGSLLHGAHRLLLQKAGGEMRSPSVVRRDRNRSRSRRKKKRSRSRSKSRPGAGRGNTRSSGSYRSPTPDGRARGQARAARKAKMIASMIGMPIPR